MGKSAYYGEASELRVPMVTAAESIRRPVDNWFKCYFNRTLLTTRQNSSRMTKGDEMKKKLSLVMTLVICVSIFRIVTDIGRVEASGTIYIRNDGSVDPPTPSILRNGDLYTFTANINDSIVVQKGNIIIDGAYYLLKGNGTGSGFNLNSVNNVTIKNVSIRDFDFGIYFLSASDNKVQGSNITDNTYGIGFFSSNSNIVSDNNVTNNNYGFWLTSSSYNTLTMNAINSNTYSIYVSGTQLGHFTQSVDASNLVNGKPVYYLVNQQDSLISPVTHPQIGYLALVNSDNVTVEGLTLASDYQGLLLAYTTNSKIRNNKMENNYYGLRLFSASYNTFSRNNITKNQNGVNLDASSYNTISENHIATNNEKGVSLYKSSDYNTISNNNITSNKAGVYLDGSVRNTVQGNHIITNAIYGIDLFTSSNNSISRNYLAKNGIGVELISSSNYNSIFRNNVTQNINNGIVLSDSSNYNSVSINSITNNAVGIYIDYSSNSSNFYANNITDNEIAGIDLGEAGDNKFFHNNFSGNAIHVEILVPGYVNVWDDGYPSGGNYWSNYTGTDEDGDGIGDVPHIIDLGNQDRYPLMNPYIEIPTDTTPPTIIIISPENKTYEARGVPLTFTISEPASWIGYSFDGQSNVTILGNVTIGNLPNGSHTITVYASDAYGNVGCSNTVYFTIHIVSPDITPPQVVILSPENKFYETTEIPLIFTVNESVTWIAYSLDNKPNVTITGNTTLVGLSESAHNIKVYALDVAGNTGASQTRYFGVQTPTPPPDHEPEPFPTAWIVVIIVAAVIIIAAILAYFKKVKKSTGKS